MTSHTPTTSQIAGQLIRHYCLEWDEERAQLEARRSRQRVSHFAYEKQLASLQKRFEGAIEEQRARLWEKEWSGYGG